MNEEEIDQDPNIEEEGSQSFQRGSRKIKDKAKNATKKIGEGIIKVAKNYFKLWATHPTAAAVITGIIIIVVLALFLLTINEESFEDTKSSTKSYYAKEGLSEESKEAAEYYNATGSYLLSTRDDLKQIAELFFEKNETKNSVLYTQMSKNMPKVHIPNGKKQDINEKKTVYEHILCAEKYNFNNINWRAYNRGKGKYEKLKKLTIDSTTGLEYPQEKQEGLNKLKFYADMVRPYLQIWLIPFSFAGSYINSDETADINTQFAYEILKEAYHKITMDRYELETLTKVSAYENYTIYRNSKTTQTECKVYELEVSYQHYYTRGQLTKIQRITVYTGCNDTTKREDKVKVEEHIETIADAKEISKTTTTNVSYLLSKALLFDKKIEKDITYTNYDLANPDSRQDIDEEINEPLAKESLRDTNYIKTNNYCIIRGANQRHNDYVFDLGDSRDSQYYSQNRESFRKELHRQLEKAETSSTRQIIKATTESETFKEGTKTTVTEKFWDKLSINDVKTESYTLDDLKKYLNKDEYGEKKEFNFVSTEETYYENLAKAEKLNRIDFINANKNIIKEYARGQDISSDNLGYTRNALFFGYEALKDNLNKQLSQYPNSIKYGTSLGIEESKMSYSFEGIENLNLEGSIIPFSPETIASGNLIISVMGPCSPTRSGTNCIDGRGSGNAITWGYSGHSGIDIQWSGEKTIAKECADKVPLGAAPIVCQQGPAVYNMVEGTLDYVYYSLYNSYAPAGYASTGNGGYKDLNTGNWGCAIRIVDKDGNAYRYLHLTPHSIKHFGELSNKIGQTIPAGEFLGYMGNTGSSSGAHLHFEAGLNNHYTKSSNTFLALAQSIQKSTSGVVDYSNLIWRIGFDKPYSMSTIKNGAANGINGDIQNLISTYIIN